MKKTRVGFECSCGWSAFVLLEGEARALYNRDELRDALSEVGQAVASHSAQCAGTVTPSEREED